MVKKILIVTKGFYPDNSPRSFRATELAKEFHRLGHDVTVMLPEKKADYSSFLKEHPINLKTFPLKFDRLTSKHKVWGEIKRKVGRMLFLLFEYPNIEIMFRLKKKLKNAGPYDVLVSIAVPHPIHWGIGWVRKKGNKIADTWIADCGDPFMGNTLETIRPPFYFKYLEKMFCEHADYITVPTDESYKAYYPEYHSKIRVIAQGFNFDDVKLNFTEANNAVPTFAYAGGLGASGIRSPKKVIEYLLTTGKDFRFHIYSNSGNVLESYAKKHPEKFIIHKPLPRPQLLQELVSMDFLLNLDNGTSNQTPSKLIDYSLVKKPILNVVAETPDTGLIDEFMEGNYSRGLVVADIEKYNIKNVAQRFLNLT